MLYKQQLNYIAPHKTYLRNEINKIFLKLLKGEFQFVSPVLASAAIVHVIDHVS